MVLILCFSTLGLFFIFPRVKYRYFFNKNITEEHILSVRHISNSKSINNRSCNFICKKNSKYEKSLLLFGDSHAGDFEFELEKYLNQQNLNLYLSYYDYRKTNFKALDQLKQVMKQEKVEYVFIIHHKEKIIKYIMKNS